MPSPHKLRVTWTRSTIGTPARHRATVRALGLHHLHESVFHDDTPSLRGMLHAVRHLVTVGSVTEEEFTAATTRVAKAPAFILRSGPPADWVTKAPRDKQKAKAAPAAKAAAAPAKAQRASAETPAAAVEVPAEAEAPASGAVEVASGKGGPHLASPAAVGEEPKAPASKAAKAAAKPAPKAAPKAKAAAAPKAKAEPAAAGEAKPRRTRAAAAKSEQEPKS
jgi:ribosomal protein L30